MSDEQTPADEPASTAYEIVITASGVVGSAE